MTAAPQGGVLPDFATPRSVAESRAVYASLLDEADRLKANVAAFRERSAAVEGRARTPEDDIRVTVGPQGELRRLEIEPRAYRKLGPAALAEEIVDLSEKARKDAAEKIAEAMRATLGRDFDVDAHLRGEPQPARESRLPVPGQPLGEWLDRLRGGRR